jgi:hypothetical protein
VTEATPLQTQADRLAAAKAAQAAREAGIRAQAIKQGRELERADTAIERAKLEAQHAGELQGVKQAHQEELTRHDAHAERLRRAHGWAMFFNGGLTCTSVAGAIIAIGLAWYTQAIMVPTFDAAREARVQDDIVRTLRPPTTDAPRSESAP